MEYISGESTLPVPFNIVPSPKCAWYVLTRLCSLCCRRDEQPPIGHPGRIKDIEMFPSTNGTVRGLVVSLWFWREREGGWDGWGGDRGRGWEGGGGRGREGEGVREREEERGRERE